VSHAETMPPDILDTPVASLELSIRSGGCLRRDNISTLRDLTSRSATDLRRIGGMGLKSLNEIREVLSQYGLALCADPPSPPLPIAEVRRMLAHIQSQLESIDERVELIRQRLAP
jgi:DNA-directed RNA polymerase alpha subunit